MGAAGRGRGRARWTAHRRQNSLGHRQNLLARGSGVTFTNMLKKIRDNLVDSAMAVTVCSRSQLCPAVAKQREQGNMVHLPGGRVDAHRPHI